MRREDLDFVIRRAALAPSVHNTQPWRFTATEHAIEVWADTDRLLGYLDPTSRQLHVSCGAAVEFARLAVRSRLGRACVVRLLPRRDEPRLLATLTIGHPEPSTPEERRLVDAMPRRHTDRGPYDGRPVPSVVMQLLREAVEERGCWLRVLDRAGDRATVTTLLCEAEHLESEDPAYRAELQAWTRGHVAPDGIPPAAQPDPDWVDRVSDVPLRDFSGAGRHPQAGGEGRPPMVERDTLVLLGSDADDPRSWLRAGRALGQLLLRLTDAGLVAQPLGPVTDVPATRVRLGRELGLVGHPQLVLRIGYGHRAPSTGRRSVDEVLAVGRRVTSWPQQRTHAAGAAEFAHHMRGVSR
jgi:hypothetical protein